MKKIINKTVLFCFACMAFVSTAQAGYVVSLNPSETIVAPGSTFTLDAFITATDGDTFGTSGLTSFGIEIDLSDLLIGTADGTFAEGNASIGSTWQLKTTVPDAANEVYNLSGGLIFGDGPKTDSIFLASMSFQSLGAGEATIGIDRAYPASPSYTAFKVDGLSIDSMITYQDATINPSAVPVPGAVWLLGSGLAGMVAMRRKKNS